MTIRRAQCLAPFAALCLSQFACSNSASLAPLPDERVATTMQPESVDGLLGSAPAVASTAPGHYEVFAQGGGNSLWQRSFEAGAWGSWVEIGDDGTLKLTVTSKPAVVSRSQGSVDLY